MFRFLIVILTLSIAGLALAADVNLSNQRTEVIKDSSHVDGVLLPTVREGGETVDTAVVIPGLPYNDTGNTCDNVHDYDEICPYSGSTSPDVVYSYTPATDETIDISLCESLYDTKVFVYDISLGLVACNDDAGCGFSGYQSKIEGLAVSGGATYYIVVDGFGGDCGDYVLDVTGFEPCVVECPPPPLEWENEPPLVDEYVDNFNGGCNSTPAVYTPIITSDIYDCYTMCCKSGWYSVAGADNRDTDWWEITMDATGQLDFTVEAEYDVNMFVINPDCIDVVIVTNATALACEPTTISWTADAGTQYWLWVGPTTFSGPVNEFTYVMNVCGIVPVESENSTWGGVKSLFR